MDEFAKGGTDSAARMDSASTRPEASLTATRLGGRTPQADRTNCRASETGIIREGGGVDGTRRFTGRWYRRPAGAISRFGLRPSISGRRGSSLRATTDMRL